jgi:hypothetical protein
MMRALAPAGVLIVSSILLSSLLGRFRVEDPLAGEWARWQDVLAESTQEEAVRRAVEAYRVRHGAYPESLARLAEDHLIAPGALGRRDAPVWNYELSPTGDSYALARH